jgi:hypothetical protein
MSRAQLTSTVEQNTGGAVAPYVAGKNFVINSSYDIWQRGTSVSVAASSSYTYSTDRWVTTTGANQAITISRQATSDTTNLPNIQYCARYQRNSGQTGTGGFYFINTFESVNSIPLAGKTVTLSFYARAGANFSAASNNLGVLLNSGTGTDQQFFGFTGSTNPISTNQAITTTWARYSFTATVPTNSTQLGISLGYTPTGTAGANDYFEVTGVQLEIGSVATPFSRCGTTFQGELALCQRYYNRIGNDGSSATYNFFSGAMGASNSTTVYVPMVFPVAMRIAPSVLDVPTSFTGLYIHDGATANTISNMTIDQPTTKNCNLAVTSTSLTQFRPYKIQANGTANIYIGLGAEL